MQFGLQQGKINRDTCMYMEYVGIEYRFSTCFTFCTQLALAPPSATSFAYVARGIVSTVHTQFVNH